MLSKVMLPTPMLLPAFTMLTFPALLMVAIYSVDSSGITTEKVWPCSAYALHLKTVSEKALREKTIRTKEMTRRLVGFVVRFMAISSFKNASRGESNRCRCAKVFCRRPYDFDSPVRVTIGKTPRSHTSVSSQVGRTNPASGSGSSRSPISFSRGSHIATSRAHALSRCPVIL